MLAERFDCHGYYKKYNMDGDINIGTGTVRVHDIFNPLPDFMKEADVIFSDPPCNNGNINAFYTKADKEESERPYTDFNDFENRFFEVISEINPKKVFLETFKDNHEKFFARCKEMYKYVEEYNIFYYKTKPCYLIVASNEPFDCSCYTGLDEDKVIEEICKNEDFKCIADCCMGTGLVGWYANKYGKRFVGTELNKKRLAMLVEGITIGKKVSL